MNTGYCPHCWPSRQKHHIFSHVDYYLERIIWPFEYITRRAKKPQQRQADRWWGAILPLLNVFGIVRFDPEPDSSKLRNRSLIFFEEAKRRGIEIEAIAFFGHYVNEFRFKEGGRWHYYEGIPLLWRGEQNDIDDKYQVKQKLEQVNLPVAKGRRCTQFWQAQQHMQAVGGPVVIKPVSGSLSRHCTRDIVTGETS